MSSRGALAAAAVAVALLCLGADVVDVLLDVDPVRLEAETQSAPSFRHPLGTDALGRDHLSRLLHGGRVSLLVATLGALIALGLGGAVGSVAGWAGGRLEWGVMRGVELAIALPKLPLMLLISGLQGPTRGESGAVLRLAAIIGLLSWMDIARLARAVTRDLRRRPFFRAAEGLGLGPGALLRLHVAPHLGPALGVALALDVGENVLYESALSYLGLGVSPPTPSWGALLAQGLPAARAAPHMVLLPGLLTILVVSALHIWVDPARRRGAAELARNSSSVPY